MNTAETLLHDRYLETVAQRGSLKQTLWEAVPGFRKKCSENGIDLARFWNKQNPGDIAQAINELRVQIPRLTSNSRLKRQAQAWLKFS